MTNEDFQNVIETSFTAFLSCGTSRSTQKLIPLHGAIAHDMHERLGDGYEIQSQGYANGKEGTITGRYMNKKVDITILRQGTPIGGIAVKFVMQNFSQNANNYFENMLGETANIRSARCPYFQIFIIPDRLPYYNKSNEIIRWEQFSGHYIEKYCVLDRDDPSTSFHSPDKMLIYVIRLPDIGEVATKDEYLHQYRNLVANTPTGFSTLVKVAQFSHSVILNDYTQFAEKVYHSIMAL